MAKPKHQAAKDKLRKLILKLGQRTIAFVPAYAHLPGCNVNAALLTFSQMVSGPTKECSKMVGASKREMSGPRKPT